MALSSLSSMSLRKTPKITNEEFKMLRDFIYDFAGIDIPLKRKYLLENRLGARLQELGLNSYAEYYKHLKFSTQKKREMDYLCEKITTNETFFFRDTKQLDAFQKYVLRQVIGKQTMAKKKELNIWSAGCSSGEEPYTLGIMLHEELKMQAISWRLKITANDLSPAMVAKARRGVYNDYAIRTTPKPILQKYFTKEPGGHKIHPKVQKLISLGLINLNDAMAVKRVPKSHIIFCRNVIIYFDDEMKRRVVQGFYDNLLPGGFLVLGHSENIHNISKAFKPIIKPGAIIYQKQA